MLISVYSRLQIKSLHIMGFNRIASNLLIQFQAVFNTSTNDSSFKAVSDSINSAIESGQKGLGMMHLTEQDYNLVKLIK